MKMSNLIPRQRLLGSNSGDSTLAAMLKTRGEERAGGAVWAENLARAEVCACGVVAT